MSNWIRFIELNWNAFCNMKLRPLKSSLKCKYLSEKATVFCIHSVINVVYQPKSHRHWNYNWNWASLWSVLWRLYSMRDAYLITRIIILTKKKIADETKVSIACDITMRCVFKAKDIISAICNWHGKTCMQSGLFMVRKTLGKSFCVISWCNVGNA